MANPNGAGMAAQNAGMIGMPAAGHYSDMQTLMQNMEALSGWLQQNREDFLQVQEGLERVERLNGRAPGHQGTVNGDSNSQPIDPEAPTLTSLQRTLDAANAHIAALESSHTEQLRLQSLYEDTLTEATERIRNYVFQQNEYLIGLHTHYSAQLATARRETIDAQLTHQQWQTALSRLGGELKRATQARAEEKDPFRRKIAALREENRVLRGKVGWGPAPKESDESSDEDDSADAIQSAVEDGSRGRAFRTMGGPSAAARREQREMVLDSVMGPSHG